MRLRRNDPALGLQAHRRTFGQMLKSRILHKAKIWGQRLMVAGVCLAPAAMNVGCEIMVPVSQSFAAPAPIEITGEYDCVTKSIQGAGQLSEAFGRVDGHFPLNITRAADGKYILARQLYGQWIPFRSSDLKVGGNQLTVTSVAATGFLNVNSRVANGKISSNGTLDFEETMTYTDNQGRIIPNSVRVKLHQVCSPNGPKKEEAKEPETPKFRKAVFIRPCQGDLYGLLPEDKREIIALTAARSTVDLTCRDLLDSGVTDIFLPFKVDDQANSHCGVHGELLYDSQYDAHENEKLKKSREAGFDPIGALIDKCR
ncbi:MAG: hypothetical protein ABIJ34_04115 [archaeon]